MCRKAFMQSINLIWAFDWHIYNQPWPKSKVHGQGHAHFGSKYLVNGGS